MIGAHPENGVSPRNQLKTMDTLYSTPSTEVIIPTKEMNLIGK